MGKAFSVIAGALAALYGAALANPDGAPWGAADPNAAQNCMSCHFDGEPVMDSATIALAGLPETVSAGEVYDLVLTFSKPEDATIAGFLAMASSGAFEAVDGEMEINATQVRSTAPLRGAHPAEWKMKWRAPEEVSDDVSFYIAVNAANDDRSPFGDEIHFKTVEVKVGE